MRPLGSRARPAEGFKVWVHDEIIDEALKDVTNDATRTEIKGYFVRGPGWSGSTRSRSSGSRDRTGGGS